MAKLKANGTEFARFEKNFDQEDGWVLVIQHSVRLKTFATKPAEIVIMRKSRSVQPLRGRKTNWGTWKLIARARTRQGALKWHDNRGWTQLSGERAHESLEA